MYTITIPYGSMGCPEPSVRGLRRRLEKGVVFFTYMKRDGSFRQARGTRNLTLDFVDFDLVPMNLLTPPAHLTTYIDLDVEPGPAWRCFINEALLYYGEEIDVDETDDGNTP